MPVCAHRDTHGAGDAAGGGSDRQAEVGLRAVRWVERPDPIALLGCHEDPAARGIPGDPVGLGNPNRGPTVLQRCREGLDPARDEVGHVEVAACVESDVLGEAEGSRGCPAGTERAHWPGAVRQEFLHVLEWVSATQTLPFVGFTPRPAGQLKTAALAPLPFLPQVFCSVPVELHRLIRWLFISVM